MTVPSHLMYTSEHEWLDFDRDTATVGVTAHAAGALGDVVYLELPAVGSFVTAGEACGEIESTKSVSDLFSPADGEVLEVNEQVVDEPAAVNLDPYGRGWLFRMRLTSTPDLLDAASYQALTGEGS